MTYTKHIVFSKGSDLDMEQIGEFPHFLVFLSVQMRSMSCGLSMRKEDNHKEK